MRRNLVPLLCLLLPTGLLAQTIYTGTQIVIVDVTVTDSHGNAVHGLKASNFKLAESGAEQRISHFDEYSASTAAQLPKMPPLEPNAYTNFTLTPESGPINILLIDTLNTPVNAQVNARKQLTAFVQNMKPGTPIAVFGLSTRLLLLQGFTSDPKLLLAAIANNRNVQQAPFAAEAIGDETLSDRLHPFNPHASASIARNEAEETSDLSRTRAVTTLSAINQLARYLSGMPGRKNLIWVSGSFPFNFLPETSSRNPNLASGALQQQLRETTNLLTRSQVAVFPVDSNGLQNTPLADASAGKYVMGPMAVPGDVRRSTERIRDDQNSMRQIAAATGGIAALDTNDLRAAVAKAIDNGANYYTLVYTPTGKKDDGSYRKITVHLAEGDYNLAYRDGYYAEDATAKPANAATKNTATAPPDAMHLAMQRGAPTPTQIIFKAIVVADPKPGNKLAEGNVASPKSHAPYRFVTIAYALNPGDITMPQRPDGTREVGLEFVAMVYDADGQPYVQLSSPVHVFAKPEGVQEFLKEGIRYQQQIAVPAKGEYYLRIGVHDVIGDKVGALEVPTAGIAIAQ